jgi:hypothetical protein
VTKRATAALVDIVATARTLEAAVIREAPSAEVEAIRGKAHDLLEAYLDRTSEAATMVRQILEP